MGSKGGLYQVVGQQNLPDGKDLVDPSVKVLRAGGKASEGFRKMFSLIYINPVPSG